MMTTNFELQNDFNACVKNYSDKTAIIYDDGIRPYITCSYKKLHEISNKIQNLLQPLNVTNKIVGFCGNVFMYLPAIYLGILNSSAAFVAIDLKNKSTWNDHLVQKLGVEIIIIYEDCDMNNMQTLQHSLGTIVRKIAHLTEEKLIIVKVTVNNEVFHNSKLPKWKLAYAIQTSGTTGIPKIIKVPHCCIIPNIDDLKKTFEIGSSEVIVMMAPLTFDPHIVEMFLALSTGSTLLIIPDQLKMRPLSLAVICMKHNVTIIQATPTVIKSIGKNTLQQTLLSASSPLRILAFGGEQCPHRNTILGWRHPENKTIFYNIYGITEVSSWATIHRINFDDYDCDSVPLGKPMFATEIEVLDADGNAVTFGEGELYIGGYERICQLDDEEESIFQRRMMRPSGDIIFRNSDGDLFLRCRRDDIIKRHGKKISMVEIEMEALKIDFIDNCVAYFDHISQKLWLFVTIKKLTEFDLVEYILNILRKNLPSHSVPEYVMCMSSFPMTVHGKIDWQALEKQRSLCRAPQKKKLTYLELQEILKNKWKNLLNMNSIDEASNFIQSGGNSFMAVFLAEEIEIITEFSFPLLLEMILQKDFKTLCNYLEEQFILHNTVNKTSKRRDSGSESVLESTSASACNSIKRLKSEGDDKKNQRCSEDQKHKLNVEPIPVEKCVQNMTVIKRGQVIKNVHFSSHKNEFENSLEMNLKLIWKYNLHKCVDSSPLLVNLHNSSASIIFIGSHSHEFVALSLESGERIWSTVFADRIESSANISYDGKYIIVGCYDQNVYILRSTTGEILWTFLTGGEVKSSPCTDPLTHLVYIGSHDHHVYALNIEVCPEYANTFPAEQQCVWKVCPGKGSVFSSPCLWLQPYLLYVATLDGILSALYPKTGATVWKENLKKPLFSSPVAFHDGVCIGCVDGFMYFYSHTGIKISQYYAEAPIFSSPCIFNGAKETRRLIFGSHDRNVYCVNLNDNNVAWKLRLPSAIYSTPHLFLSNTLNSRCQKPRGETEENQSVYPIIVTVSTSGFLQVVDLFQGKELTSYQFPGEVFSSPVVFNNKLIVGCRDNNVYCLDLCILNDK